MRSNRSCKTASVRRAGGVLARGAVALALLVATRGEARAQAGQAPPPSSNEAAAGDGIEALPALVRVPVATDVEPGVAFTGTAGYGFTENVLRDNDAHHRAFGVFAASVRPLSWLAFGLRFDGRYDAHTSTQGPDDGLVGEPRVMARVAHRFGPALGLGLQTTLWLPSGDAPSLNFDAASVEFEAVGSYAPARGPIAFTAEAGFRFDQSAASARQAAALSASDRLALGVSSAHAVVMGAGVVGRVGRVLELLGEWRWDLLVGNDRIAPLTSPMHVRAGARLRPTTAADLRIGLFADVSPSARPSIAPGEPLVPVDPRVAVMLTVGVGIPFRRGPSEAELAAARERDRRARAEAAQSAMGELRGHVTAPGGNAPLAGARVEITGPRGPAGETTTDAAGDYHFERLPPGEYTVRITAQGAQPFRSPVTVAPRSAGGGAAVANVTLEPALPVGQIRGVVRAFSGEPVRGATIRVEQLNESRTTEADGTFQIDAAPGEYTVLVSQTGYEAQRRPVRVEQNGVTILNVDLRRGRR